MKKPEPCAEFKSKHPGEGAHYPDPCKACGWSRPDHNNYHRARREAAMEAALTALDAFQRDYEAATYDTLPGNTHWSGRLMVVVKQARATLQKGPII